MRSLYLVNRAGDFSASSIDRPIEESAGSFIIFRLSHTPIYISQVLVSRVLSESESTWTKTRRKIVSIQQNADPVTGDANTEHRAPDTGISGKGDCDSGINYTWG